MQASKLRHPRAFKTRTAWRLAGHLCFALCKCLEAQVDQPPSTSLRPPAACCCPRFGTAPAASGGRLQPQAWLRRSREPGHPRQLPDRCTVSCQFLQHAAAAF